MDQDEMRIEAQNDAEAAVGQTIRLLRAENSRLRVAATAALASIQTRCGQIDKARATFGTDAVSAIDRIEHASNALRTAAIDLRNALGTHT